MFDRAFTGLDDSAASGGIGRRGLFIAPSSVGSPAATGGIMMIRWQPAVPPVGGTTAATGVAGAAATPLAGGAAIGGTGLGASEFAGLALSGPSGWGPNNGFQPNPFGPLLPAEGGGPGGGRFPGGGGASDGSNPDSLTPPSSVVVVPEPTTFSMAAAGIVGLLVLGRRSPRARGAMR